MVTLVSILAGTLITSLGVVVTATEQGAVRGALSSSTAAETEMRTLLSHPTATLEQLRADVPAAVDEQLVGAADADSSSLALSELHIVPRTGQLFALTYYGELDDLAEHAALVDGVWPSAVPTADTVEVAVPANGAAELKLTVGSVLRVAEAQGTPPTPVTVVGIYEVVGAGDLYWRSDRVAGAGHLDLYPVPGTSGALNTDLIGPLVVPTGTFDAIVMPVERLVITQQPDFSELRVDELVPLLNHARSAGIEVPTVLGEVADTVVYLSGLDIVLQSIASALTVTRSTVVVLSLLLLVLAVVALTQTARLLTEARLGERHLMNARGSSTRQLIGLTAIEAVVIAVVTAGLSPILARFVYQLVAAQPAMVAAGMSSDPGLPLVTWVLAAAVAVVFAAVLVAPLLRRDGTFHEGEQGKSRQRRATGLQRSGIDIAILVLAAVAYSQLISYRSAVGDAASLSVDPILAAGPALVLLAGALLAVRVVPAASKLAERIAVGARGIVAPLAAWEVGRRSQRATAAILLLTLALAVGTFSQTFFASWRQSQLDQAAFAVGAPVRVTVDSTSTTSEPTLPAGASGEPQPTMRREATIGGPSRGFGGPKDGEAAVVLGLTEQSRRMLLDDRLAADGGSRVVDALGAGPEEPTTGVSLQGDVQGLRATVRLAADSPLPSLRANVRGIIEDEFGLLFTVDFGIVRFDSEERTLVALLPPSTDLNRDLRLVGVQAIIYLDESQGEAQGNSITGAALAVKDLGIVQARTDTKVDEGSTWPGDYVFTALTLDPDAHWFTAGNARANEQKRLPDRPDGWQLGLKFEVPIGMVLGPVVIAEIGWPAVQALPVVLSTTLAERLNVERGAELELLVDDVVVRALVKAVVDQVPGGGSATEFTALTLGRVVTEGAANAVIGDQELLARTLVQSGSSSSAIDEWWVDIPRGAGDEYVAAVEAGDGPLSALGRESLGTELQQHPLRVATQAALWLVLGGAALLTAVGFAIHATGALRSRALEFAQLRAIGLSRRRLIAVIATESLLLSLFGTIVGVALGLALGHLVAPLVGASADGSPPIPDVDIVVPWTDIAMLTVEVGVVLAIVVLVAARMQRTSDPASVLRMGDER